MDRADVVVREAVEEDVEVVRDIFEAVYGPSYPYRCFYDTQWLKKSIFSDDILTLVAETEAGVVGTASVVYSAGARSDFVGEFGRLAVHPDAREQGVGRALMEHRIQFAQRRLHAGIIENRTEHPYSQRIALKYGFAPVGLLPLKHSFFPGDRESVAMFLRLFGPSLDLRRNHPRIVAEVNTLAHLSMEAVGMKNDAIIDDTSSPYPYADGFATETFEAETMSALLRIERGRVHHREIFGPIRLHYGFFKLSNRNAQYLVARTGESGPLLGAVGYLHDAGERALRVFEMLCTSDEAPRFLMDELLTEARALGVEYVEVDVSAHAPRMQRTLIELGFLPAAYVPALVFEDVERVDVVKMVRLFVHPDLSLAVVQPEVEPFLNAVRAGFRERSVLPQIEDGLDRVALFRGLDPQQRRAVAALGELHHLEEGSTLFAAGESADAMFVVLDGRVSVHAHGETVGTVVSGESVGEVAMLVGDPHTATGVVEGPATVVSFNEAPFEGLIRRRPDVGVVLYRNLAVGLGSKLRRVDVSLAEASTAISE